MRVVLQRVRSASVTVNDKVVGAIGHGLVALVGITHTDNAEVNAWMARKVLEARIFADDAGMMNRSVVDVGGSILVVSQFTLYGELRKGTRPSYGAAATPDVARERYDQFVDLLRTTSSVTIATGVFGAMMQVSLCNDGPVTLILERETP